MASAKISFGDHLPSSNAKERDPHPQTDPLRTHARQDFSAEKSNAQSELTKKQDSYENHQFVFVEDKNQRSDSRPISEKMNLRIFKLQRNQ